MPNDVGPEPGLGISFRWTDDYQDANGPDGEIITAQLHTPWTIDNLKNFPAAMKGANGRGGGPVIIRAPLPYRHPHKDWLYCTQCDLQGGIGYVDEETSNKSIKFGTPTTLTGLASPNQTATPIAVWSAQWNYLGYDVETDEFKSTRAGNGKELVRFVSRKVKSSLESLPIPGTEWKWTADGNPIHEPTTVLLAMKELEYTWWHVPFPYRESTWDDLLGKVNNATFDGRGRSNTGLSYPSYAIGTTYFANYEQGDPFTDPFGNICCHTTFFFLYRRQGWNNFYRPGSGFAAVQSADGAGRYPFPPGDLMTIFD